MAMNVGSPTGSSDPDVLVDINTTPLIDVMLVLLIMLIITIPVQLHAVKLDMPINNPPPPAKPPIVVRLDIGADSVVRWNGEAITDTGVLQSRLSAAAQQAEQPELHLRPDRAASYNTVASVMAAVQRNGLTKIGIVGSEQFL